MVSKVVFVKNKNGLHMRPAEVLVRLTSQFDSEITLSKDDIRINGKSILGVMSLAAENGSAITIEVAGSDEENAMKLLIEMFSKDLEV